MCIHIRRLVRSNDGPVGDVRRLIVILDNNGGIRNEASAGPTASDTGIRCRQDGLETVIAFCLKKEKN